MNRELVLDAEKSFIGAWFLEDLSVCDELIEYFENSENKMEGMVWRDTENTPRIDKDEKDSVDIDLRGDTEIGQKYVSQLQQVLDMYSIKYKSANEVAWFSIESINVQKYPPGGGYKKWHKERSGGLSPGVYRHLVFMTYLNDIDDEGETEFLYQKLKVKPRKGLTLIWPADWTHTHRGIPTPTETKYIVTGWYTFTLRDEVNE